MITLWRSHVGHMAQRRPFLLSLIVLLLIVIPGYVRIEWNQHTNCERANNARRDQITLWSYIIKQASPNQTPQQRRVIADFQARLDQIFAPRKCGW